MKTVTFNNKSNHDFNLQILDWERHILPDLENEYREIAGKDIKRNTKESISNQTLRIEFLRKNKDIDEWLDVRNEIVEWLFTREEVKIEVDDEPDIYYVGKVTSTDIPQKYMTAVRFWVEFTCHPVKYGKLVETNETEFTYDGTYDKTPFKITLENVTTDELVVSVNGVEIKYTEPLQNATVTIDSDELELRVNGELKVFEVEGYFSFLKPGQNVIETNVDADITIEYMELFL